MLDARATMTAARWQLDENGDPLPECEKCGDTGVIYDSDYGTGNGPYWHKRCDCPAGPNATHPSWENT